MTHSAAVCRRHAFNWVGALGSSISIPAFGDSGEAGSSADALAGYTPALVANPSSSTRVWAFRRPPRYPSRKGGHST